MLISILYAIIIVCLFLGGYAILKRMFPDSKSVFDYYLIGWIVLLLIAGGKRPWTLVYMDLVYIFTGQWL